MIEYLINSRLDKLVYFHPFISIVINIVLLIDLFFIPITFIAIDILKAQKNSIIKFFQIILSGIGIRLLSFTVIFVPDLSDDGVTLSITPPFIITVVPSS